jgi:ATP-dependent protease HslVU (ClpYQ) peptidase subunit
MENTATCIVALVDKGKIIIGGDSAGTNSFSLRSTIRKDKKVFMRQKGKDKWVFGFTTSYRMGQLVQYVLDLPVYDESMDLHQFMVTKFVPALRTCFQGGGFENKKEERVSGGSFIVGFKGTLFVIQSDYQVAIASEPYTAVGCGESIALGALSALTATNSKLTPEKKLRIALEAAEQYSAGVRAPFHFVSI